MNKWILKCRRTSHSGLFTCLAFIFIFAAISAAQYEYPDLAGEPNFINFDDFTAFAANWQKTGSGLAGDFDKNGIVDINDLAYFSFYWLTGHWECEKIDLDYSGRIDFADFVIFADCWLSDTGSSNYKSSCDFNGDGSVDIYDLKAFCDCWLKGARPQDLWGKFKAALAADNINEALSYISEISRDKYSQIFYAIEPNLPGFAEGMGEITLTSSTPGQAKYEMLHSESGQAYSFPVTFVKDDDGSWKIYNF